MKNMVHLLKVLGLVATVGFAGHAAAHDDATLATMKSPHGGQMKVAGGWHLELVQNKGALPDANILIVYVTDHDGKAVPTTGFNGSATILAGKDKLKVTFAPDGENRLKTGANYDRGAKPKIVVSVTGNGKTEQARFVP